MLTKDRLRCTVLELGLNWDLDDGTLSARNLYDNSILRVDFQGREKGGFYMDNSMT